MRNLARSSLNGTLGLFINQTLEMFAFFAPRSFVQSGLWLLSITRNEFNGHHVVIVPATVGRRKGNLGKATELSRAKPSRENSHEMKQNISVTARRKCKHSCESSNNRKHKPRNKTGYLSFLSEREGQGAFANIDQSHLQTPSFGEVMFRLF